MRNRTFFVLLIIVSSAIPAAATTIVLDPGPVGTSFGSELFMFDDLDGVALDGRSLALDFVLGDMKHLELAFNNDDPTRTHIYQVTLRLFHDLGTLPPAFPFASGFLSDESGASLLEQFNTGTSRGLSRFSYFVSFTETMADGLIHHGIHLDATLPIADGRVTDASLGLVISSLPDGEIRVGNWGRVPEPSSIWIFVTGALGLVGFHRSSLPRT